jgi:hypothetical protein
MMNYETLILDHLLGENPKEKYNYLIELEKKNDTLRVSIEVALINFKAIKDTSDEATIGNLRIFFDSLFNYFEKIKGDLYSQGNG